MKQISALTQNKSLRELNILIKISQSIISTLDYQAILQIISDGMAELFEIETAAMYILEDENTIFLGATTPPLPPGMPENLRRTNLKGHVHIKKTIDTRKTQVIIDSHAAELTKEEQEVVKIRNLRSLIYFPFVQHNKVLGVLILGTCNNVREFTQSEIDFGQTIANQLTVSINNSLLHAELLNHKYNLENLVNDKTKELDAAIEELQSTNEELYEKNELINNQNNELKATLDHLKETQSQLIQSEKMASLGVLTAGVAHEINNPLNFISGAYSGLEDYFKCNGEILNKKISLYLTSINTALERITSIVTGLNYFSRETGSMDETCDIHSIIDNCLVMLNNQIKHRIKIVKNYSDSHIIINGNVGKLHQVFLNILSNATQAIQKEGSIEITTINEDKSITVTITDNGHGIKQEDLSKIIDPFYTTKEPGKGTGLGLAICYSIIKEHKGKLEFESEINKGTTALVTLPVN